MSGAHRAEHVHRDDAPQVATRLVVPSAHAMRTLGRDLAGLLTDGDLVVLTGDLGAGKTTLTQGIGAGLGVRDDDHQPHLRHRPRAPAARRRPSLVHVDAYRLELARRARRPRPRRVAGGLGDRRRVGRGAGRGPRREPARDAAAPPARRRRGRRRRRAPSTATSPARWRSPGSGGAGAASGCPGDARSCCCSRSTPPARP